MGKRFVFLLGCFAVIAFGRFLTLWVTRPVDRITRAEFENIRPGMTVEEVEKILGKPTENDAEAPIIMFEGVPMSFASPDLFPPEKLRQWIGKDHAILAELDDQGRVSDMYFGHTNRPPDFLAKLRRWLRL